MSSPFPAGSSFSSASSPLYYLIPPRPHLNVHGGFSCDVLTQAGYGAGSVESAVGAAGATARQGGRHPQLPRPTPRQCPRCRSANTKFCYYNNYSQKQPRYLCRACRRHWTEGGTLRDVPVGGGRKNRRGKGGAKLSTTATFPAAAATAAGSGGHTNAFPDILRQMLFQQPASCTDVGGYSIDLSAWHQMAAATAPQGTGDAGAFGGSTATADASFSGAVQYWTGWQVQDDLSGFDGSF